MEKQYCLYMPLGSGAAIPPVQDNIRLPCCGDWLYHTEYCSAVLNLQVPMATAFAVLLDHSAVTSDQQIVCNLLQVCKAWRTAVHQSGAAITNIDTAISPKVGELPKIAHLAAWISLYPSLIRTISITREHHDDGQTNVETCRRLLELGLRLAAAGTSKAADPCPALGAMPLGAGSRTHHRWALQRFNCDLEASPAMLTALPAATLTRLALSCINPSEMPLIAASIPGLSRLQELVAISRHFTSGQPSADCKLLAAVESLKQLRILHLGCVQNMVCLQRLPIQLQQLTIQVAPVPGTETAVQTDLGYLTNLKRLEIDVDSDWSIRPGSVLPANLTFLCLETNDRNSIRHFGITTLQHLQYLSMGCAMLELRTLTTMSQLQQLHLTDQQVGVWNDTTYAQQWSKLSMLRSLGVHADCEDPGSVISLCSSAGKAAGITNLDLLLVCTFQDLDAEEVELAASMSLCPFLTTLQELQDLSLSLPLGEDFVRHVCLAKHDLLHLTCLTGLTRLHVRASGGADDTIVCALVAALSQLRCLSLPNHRLTTAPLPSMGLLKGLQRLELCSYKRVDAEFGLNFLTGLHRLTHLGGFDKACESALTSFWTALRGQQQR